MDELFHNGSSFLLYPFRLTFLVSESLPADVPVQVVISVPKRRFKRAVDRNLLKRRMREIYRLNKQELVYSWMEKPLLLGVSFIGKEIADYPVMEKKLKLALVRLRKQIEEQYAGNVD